MTKAVLVIHGFLGSPLDFGDLPEKLVDYYDEVFTLTLPGHSSGDDYDYDLFKAQETIDGCLNAYDRLKEKYDLIDVIGHSMGGSLATLITNKRDVNKLVLLAPAIKFLNPMIVFSKIKFWYNNTKLLHEARKHNDLESIEEYNYKSQIVKDNDKNSMNVFKTKYLRRFIFKAIRQFILITKECMEESKCINCPLLVVWGKLDQMVPYSAIKYVQGICTNEVNELIVCEEASHLMMIALNGPEITMQIIDFLKRDK